MTRTEEIAYWVQRFTITARLFPVDIRWLDKTTAERRAEVARMLSRSETIHGKTRPRPET